MSDLTEDAWWREQTSRATAWVLTEEPCICGHVEDRHLSLATSNRCVECSCEGYAEVQQ